MKKDKRITEHNQKLIDLQIDQLQTKNIKIKELELENFQLKKDLRFEITKHNKSEIIKQEFFQKINNVLGVSPIFIFDQIVDLVEEHLELIVTNAGQIDDLESTIKSMETDFDEEEREIEELNNERTELIKKNLLKESIFQEYKKIWKKKKDDYQEQINTLQQRLENARKVNTDKFLDNSSYLEKLNALLLIYTYDNDEIENILKMNEDQFKTQVLDDVEFYYVEGRNLLANSESKLTSESYFLQRFNFFIQEIEPFCPGISKKELFFDKLDTIVHFIKVLDKKAMNPVENSLLKAEKQKDELGEFREIINHEKENELFELCMELYNRNINQNIFEKRLIETEEYKDLMDKYHMEQNKLYP